MKTEIIPVEIIENKIFVIRGHKVMIDRDLAELYGVLTKRLNEAVKRNISRFPDDFMFKLNDDEKNKLVANCDRFQALVHSTSNPYAFTEQGVAMLSSVLNSDQAVAVNIQIMRTFVKLRDMALAQSEMAMQLRELEQRFIQYSRDTNIEIEEIFKQLDYLKDITKPTEVGFRTK